MMKRRFIQGLLILALLCGAVLLAHPSAAWAMEGTGSKDDPYQISTAADLQEFASLVNSGNRDACAVLMGDIVLNEKVLNEDGNLNKGAATTFTKWTPIGRDEDNPYTGTFDGNGHEISGLYIDSNAEYVGLFGCIGSDGTVKNLILVDSYIGRVLINTNNVYIGSICGWNNGSITNCSNSGAIWGTFFYVVTGDVVKTDYGGGICGENQGIITNCSNSGNMLERAGGGICGTNNGCITNCYWLEGTGGNGVDSGSGEATVEKVNEYASGEVAWLLNQGQTDGPWRQNLSGNDKDEFPTLDPTHDTVVQLTFNANTGKEEDNSIVYGNAGSALPNVTLPEITGYTFGGWYDNEALSGEPETAIPDDATGAKTYYAKWTANTYKVTLNTKGGTIAGGKDVTNYTYGIATALPTEQDITRTGYTFDGWYEDENFSSSVVTVIPDNATGDKTYYAKWTANTYTVNLNANGGTIADGKDVTNYTYGTATALPTEQDITHTGFNFGGWYDNAAFSGAPVTGITTTDFGDKTYYAKWTAEVTLNTNGGTVNSGNVTNYTYGTETSLPTDVTRAGYTFAGWYDNEALEGDAVTVIPADAMGAKEYWAKWTAKSYPSAPPTVSEETIDAIQAADSGETVTVDLSSGDTTLDKEVFETLAGRDVTLVVELGDGVSWTVNGSDIPEDADFTDIDMGVTMNSDGIPVDVVNAITDERSSVQITLAHDGAFGFTMTLTAPLGAENAGLWANLYHFDEDANAMTFETAAPIGSDGSVSLSLSHASQYAIVIDDHNHGVVTLPFTDVSADDWFYDPVCYVYSQGLMTGTSATTFEPKTHLSRAMLVAVLHRLEGSPQASAGDFTDVAEGDWYAQAVNWAASVGVVNGFDDGTFQPNAAITREQMAAILRNYAQYKGLDVTASGDLVNYSDAASVSNWAKDSVVWEVDQGLLSGMTVDTLQPQGLSTRAQVAAVLQRYLAN